MDLDPMAPLQVPLRVPFDLLLTFSTRYTSSSSVMLWTLVIELSKLELSP